jgi:hypothetical protein
MPELERIDGLRKQYDPRHEWIKDENNLAWAEWALTTPPGVLAPDTTDYARKPTLVEIYRFVTSCMP